MFVLIKTIGQNFLKKCHQDLSFMQKKQNYSLIIAIANAQATPAWINSISMKFLKNLDVFLTYNLSEIEKLNISNEIFRSLWDDKLINWRRSNPSNPVKSN